MILNINTTCCRENDHERFLKKGRFFWDTSYIYIYLQACGLIDVSPHTIDKICKKKYGHTNWARINAISPEEIAGNPCEIDVEHGVIFFKNKLMV